MIVVHLLAAVATGIGAAVATLWSGGALWLAVLAYAGGGAAGLVASAAASLLLPGPRDGAGAGARVGPPRRVRVTVHPQG